MYHGKALLISWGNNVMIHKTYWKNVLSILGYNKTGLLLHRDITDLNIRNGSIKSLENNVKE